MSERADSDSYHRAAPNPWHTQRRGADLERHLNLWRIGIAGVLGVAFAGSALVRGFGTLEDTWALSVAIGYAVVAVLFHFYLDRRPWDDRLPRWVVASDICVITGILLGYVVFDRAIAAVNSQLVFCCYFMVVAMAGLRSHPRVARMVTAGVPTAYALVVFIAVSWRHVELSLPDPQFGSFRWDIQVARVFLLAAVTWFTHLETALGVSDRAEARRDPLTGLYNRRFLEDFLGRELPRARRRQQPFSILVLDLDEFKAYNDQHGHLEGDRMLCRVATALAGAVRANDIIARYGGDEFIVVLPNTPGESARRVARELIHVAPGQVGLSAGVGCLGAGIETVEELLEVADRALRRAKQVGGGGVVAG